MKMKRERKAHRRRQPSVFTIPNNEACALRKLRLDNLERDHDTVKAVIEKNLGSGIPHDLKRLLNSVKRAIEKARQQLLVEDEQGVGSPKATLCLPRRGTGASVSLGSRTQMGVVVKAVDAPNRFPEAELELCGLALRELKQLVDLKGQEFQLHRVYPLLKWFKQAWGDIHDRPKSALASVRSSGSSDFSDSHASSKLGESLMIETMGKDFELHELRLDDFGNEFNDFSRSLPASREETCWWPAQACSDAIATLYVAKIEDDLAQDLCNQPRKELADFVRLYFQGVFAVNYISTDRLERFLAGVNHFRSHKTFGPRFWSFGFLTGVMKPMKPEEDDFGFANTSQDSVLSHSMRACNFFLDTLQGLIPVHRIKEAISNGDQTPFVALDRALEIFAMESRELKGVPGTLTFEEDLEKIAIIEPNSGPSGKFVDLDWFLLRMLSMWYIAQFHPDGYNSEVECPSRNMSMSELTPASDDKNQLKAVRSQAKLLLSRQSSGTGSFHRVTLSKQNSRSNLLTKQASMAGGSKSSLKSRQGSPPLSKQSSRRSQGVKTPDGPSISTIGPSLGPSIGTIGSKLTQLDTEMHSLPELESSEGQSKSPIASDGSRLKKILEQKGLRVSMRQFTEDGLDSPSQQLVTGGRSGRSSVPALSRQSTAKGRLTHKETLPAILSPFKSEEQLDLKVPQTLSMKRSGIFAIDSPSVNSQTKIGPPPPDAKGLVWGMDMRLLFDRNGNEVQIEEARATYRHQRTVKSMTIMCRSPYNKINTMRCSVAMTIADVKEEMSRAWGAKELVVMWNGKKLYDHESLENLGVEHNASFQFLDPLSLGESNLVAEFGLLKSRPRSGSSFNLFHPSSEWQPAAFEDDFLPRSRQSQSFQREGFERLDTAKIIGARWKKPKNVQPRSIDYRLYKYYN